MYSGFSVPCCSTPPWLVTSQRTWDVSATVLYYIYVKENTGTAIWLGKGSFQSRACPQQLTKELANRRHFTPTCLYIQHGEPHKRKMCHHISYYSNSPGPRGSLKHKETDHFIEDTVTHWNNSVKSACREMAGYELGKTNRFRDVFLNSIRSVKEWLFCSDPKRWYFCGRDIYLYFYAICIFPTISGFKPLFWRIIIALNHEISYLLESCCKSWCERSVKKNDTNMMI